MFSKSCWNCSNCRRVVQRHYTNYYCHMLRFFTITEVLLGRDAMIKRGNCPYWTDNTGKNRHIRSWTEDAKMPEKIPF